MQRFERLALRLRHHPLLRRADWLWDGLRPRYDRLLARLGIRGLARTINGSDPLRLLPRYRNVPERYEPEVWPAVMAELRPGDAVADIGAFIGLYTVAMANRVGPAGRVVAFEPNPVSFAALQAHLALNGLAGRVEARRLAVGDADAALPFSTGEMTAAVAARPRDDTVSVRCVRLDGCWGEAPLDVLKVDVEGYEEHVLRGAAGILARPAPPRTIFIEVHPYAWGPLGASGPSLLGLLESHGYRVTGVGGGPMRAIEAYGEIVARRA